MNTTVFILFHHVIWFSWHLHLVKPNVSWCNWIWSFSCIMIMRSTRLCDDEFARLGLAPSGPESWTGYLSHQCHHQIYFIRINKIIDSKSSNSLKSYHKSIISKSSDIGQCHSQILINLKLSSFPNCLRESHLLTRPCSLRTPKNSTIFIFKNHAK